MGENCLEISKIVFTSGAASPLWSRLYRDFQLIARFFNIYLCHIPTHFAAYCLPIHLFAVLLNYQRAFSAQNTCTRFYFVVKQILICLSRILAEETTIYLFSSDDINGHLGHQLDVF